MVLILSSRYACTRAAFGFNLIIGLPFNLKAFVLILICDPRKLNVQPQSCSFACSQDVMKAIAEVKYS